MQAKPKAWRSRKTEFIFWPALILAVLTAIVGCGDDRSKIERLLDARQKALNHKDLEAYMRLIAPDYVPGQPGSDLRTEMAGHFANLAVIDYQIFSRTITFEEPFARIVQEYRMTLTNMRGKTTTIDGVDHFLVKRYGFGPFKKWLIYRGLDAPARNKPAAPAAANQAGPAEAEAPAVTPAPAESGGSAQ